MAFVAGIVATLLAAYPVWYAMQPKITRIEWSNGMTMYFRGRIDPEELKRRGYWPATEYPVKSKTVLIEPDFGGVD